MNLKQYEKIKNSKGYDLAMEWVNYGENYLYDNPRMALSVYDKAIEFNSKIDLVYYKKGYAHQKLNENQEALECYDKAIKLNPKIPDTHNLKGLIHYKLNEIDLSLKSFDKAIKLNDKFLAAYQNKGQILQDQQKYQESLIYFNKALNLDDKDGTIWYSKGISLCELQEWRQCFLALQEAYDITKNYDYIIRKSQYEDMQKLSQIYNGLKYQKALGKWTDDIEYDNQEINNQEITYKYIHEIGFTIIGVIIFLLARRLNVLKLLIIFSIFISIYKNYY